MITGIYSCNDGGFYYVRTIRDADGERLFWFGESADGRFSNVHIGVLRAVPDKPGAFSIDDGVWLDVPKGGIAGAGTLDLILENETIQKLHATGGFGGSQWRKVSRRPACGAGGNLRGFTGEGLTGTWIGSNGGIYYVRQRGADVAWFAEGNANPAAIPAFANVFYGRLAGSTVTGNWADVPYGASNGSGTLSLRVVSNDRIERVGPTSGLGSRFWVRSSSLGNRVVNSLQVTISTGGDDLRSGALAYGIVDLRGRGTLPKVILNRGGWGNGSTNTATVPVSRAGEAPIRLRDLASFILEHDGSPRNVGETYDNWNVDFIKVVANTPEGAVCIASACGQPVVRLTGQRTLFTLPIALPALTPAR